MRARTAALTTAIGALALSYPLINVPNQQTLVAGIPMLYLYVFGVWIALIVAGAILASSRPTARHDPKR
jgi:hypothetical protein